MFWVWCLFETALLCQGSMILPSVRTATPSERKMSPLGSWQSMPVPTECHGKGALWMPRAVGGATAAQLPLAQLAYPHHCLTTRDYPQVLGKHWVGATAVVVQLIPGQIRKQSYWMHQNLNYLHCLFLNLCESQLGKGCSCSLGAGKGERFRAPLLKMPF